MDKDLHDNDLDLFIKFRILKYFAYTITTKDPLGNDLDLELEAKVAADRIVIDLAKNYSLFKENNILNHHFSDGKFSISITVVYNLNSKTKYLDNSFDFKE